MMPHYKNGREAKVGDKIVGKSPWAGVFAGTILVIHPNTDTCNANYVPTGTPTQTASLSDCLHEEDVILTETMPLGNQLAAHGIPESASGLPDNAMEPKPGV